VNYSWTQGWENRGRCGEWCNDKGHNLYSTLSNALTKSWQVGRELAWEGRETYCHVLRMGSVTDNSTWFELVTGFFTMAITAATQVTITMITIALAASHSHDSLWALTSSNFGGWLTKIHFEGRWTRTNFVYCLPFITPCRQQWKHWPSYCWLPCNATIPEWWAYPWEYSTTTARIEPMMSSGSSWRTTTTKTGPQTRQEGTNCYTPLGHSGQIALMKEQCDVFDWRWSLLSNCSRIFPWIRSPLRYCCVAW
jgi:hypothetical protein